MSEKNNSSLCLEICVDNISSAIAAEKGGAHRIELCHALEVGGLTPSPGLISTAKNLLTIPIFMLIRPRTGHFTYSALEACQMIEDIRYGLSLGIDGFVTGGIRDNKVDSDLCARLISSAKGLPMTFHRAFDLISDDDAISDIVQLGFSRILTSGRAKTAFEGMDTIKSLVAKADSRIIIMPGAGVTPDNLEELLLTTSATEFHSSAQVSKDYCVKDNFVTGSDNYPLASATCVKAMADILKNRLSL